MAIKNIERNVFLLKRENKFDLRAGKDQVDEEGDPIPVTIGDVYEEFNSKMAGKEATTPLDFIISELHVGYTNLGYLWLLGVGLMY